MIFFSYEKRFCVAVAFHGYIITDNVNIFKMEYCTKNIDINTCYFVQNDGYDLDGFCNRFVIVL